MRRFWMGVVFAVGCYRSATPPPEPAKPEPSPSATQPTDPRATPARSRHEPRAESTATEEQMLADFAAFTDAACACTDKACTERVTKDMDAWAQSMPQRSKPLRPSDAAQKEMIELATAMADCMMKVMSPPTTP